MGFLPMVFGVKVVEEGAITVNKFRVCVKENKTRRHKSWSVLVKAGLRPTPAK
jgi:hypothetical protein